ncbi:MAG: sensor histidine kinase [Oscillospiraceae bacterium]|jgi:two-component system sensor histidine kinase YesM|nr:sensor histidine kinase [Oscillospiraceae bacterium]
MKRLSKAFLNIKFRNKVMMFCILVALIPFIIFAVVVGSVFIGQVRTMTMDHTAQLIGQVQNSLDVYISGIEEIADYITVVALRYEALSVSARDTRWLGMQVMLDRDLEDLANSRPKEIAGILIAFEDDRYVGTGMSRISRDPFTDENWYREACAEPGKMVLISNATGRNIVTNKDYSADDVFSLAKAIVDPDTGETKGVVLLDVRHEIIQESINRVSIGKQGFVFVLDGRDNMVYAPVNDIVFRVNPAWLSGNGNRPVTARIKNGSYHIRCDNSEYTGWKTVGVFSFDEIMGSVNTIYYILMFFIVGTAGIVAAMSFQIAKSVTKPVHKLRSLMQEAESGDLSVRFNSRYNDEIGDLGVSFNHMLDRIRQLIQKVYEEQQSKREAELKSLQEQIKPHFLYNTLDTITWMARNYDARDIVLLVDAMTNMFRIGLSGGTDVISLEEEIKHVSNYLYIQGIRYKDKLKCSIQIDPALYNYQVPKLILQPLAENAIYHGIKQKRGGGTITIEGGLRGDNDLWLSVKDNGAGIEAEHLQYLNECLREVHRQETKEGFGLFYIQKRLVLSYGEDYGLELGSVKGEGTVATVTIPLRERK